MTTPKEINLSELPRFRPGDIVTLNGVTFRIDTVEKTRLWLVAVDSYGEFAQAVSQALTDQLRKLLD